MQKNVHYSDNIFFLKVMIKNLQATLKLRIDPELFSEKICEDLLFLDKTIQQIFSLLKSNTNLIKRDEHLHSIKKLKWDFTVLIKSFLEIDKDEFAEIRTFEPQMKRALDVHSSNIDEIKELLKNRDANMAKNDIISYDELNFLMAPGLSSEEDLED